MFLSRMRSAAACSGSAAVARAVAVRWHGGGAALGLRYRTRAAAPGCTRTIDEDNDDAKATLLLNSMQHYCNQRTIRNRSVDSALSWR